jgi:Zn-dependent protease with chaperone function
MRDFFERQETARKKTTLLIGLFSLAIVLIVLAVYVVLNGMYFALLVYNARNIVPFDFWDPARFVVICLIVVAGIVGGTLYKVNKLKGGGYRVARLLGGRRVQRNTADLNEKKLLNVVEEMAIASGVPVPEAYVMDKETGINAFAAGYGIEDAVVCVTGGCLKLLNRDELQAVVAHEFSHIFNGDTAMNIRLMGWLHGILVISLSGQAMLHSLRYVRGRGWLGLAVLGSVLYVMGYIGMFFGKIIKSAVSRQREFLGDASAVQFTRNPPALSGALKKIGGVTFGPILTHPKAAEASHMFICDGVGGNFFGFMATHPPLVERIRRLEPRFDGVFPKVKAVAPEAEPRPKPAISRGQAAGGVVTGAMAVAILDSIGAPMKEHADAARALLDEVPEAVRTATREAAGARALIYVLLLDNDEEVHQRQIEILKEFTTPEAFAEADTIACYLPSVPPRLRLPLVDLSVPALKTLTGEEYERFKDVVKRLTEEDGELSLFEFVLGRVLISHLDALFLKPKRRIVQVYGIGGVANECSLVLSALARAAKMGEEESLLAFESGRKILAKPGLGIRFLAAEECKLAGLERALDRLAGASPLIKKKLMAACLETIASDREIGEEEAELFRAVGVALGVPVPPWLMFREGRGAKEAKG